METVDNLRNRLSVSRLSKINRNTEIIYLL